VSRTINTPIIGTLSLLPTDNPLTITASGRVNATADAIDGDSSTAWAISNAGKISSATGYGVFLAGAGSVTNYSGGSISGTGPTGFNVISGVSIGGSGTVTNRGTISVLGGGYGVHLAGGGAVTNRGIVTGGEDGVLIEGAPGQINNTGAISASVDDGAALFAGGTITNSATGSIQGSLVGPIAAGVFIKVGSGNLQNDGVVIGNKFGVLLTAGGSVTNGAGDASAKISGVGSVGVSGTSFGVFVTGNSATVTNYGTIDGGPAAGSEGAELDQGGNVTNHSGGTIRGTGFGLFVTGNSAATVTNAGAISGTIASVEFAGTGANTLTLQTGSRLTGDAIGSTAGGATNALVLQGKGTANNNFDNFNTLDVQANASWTLGGDSTFGATTVSSGRLVVAGDLSSGPATLGDAAGDLAQLMIASTGIWDIHDDSGIGLGNSPSGGGSGNGGGNGNGNGNGGGNGNGNGDGNGGGNGSFISNSGLFEKTGGSGTSAIAPQLLNKGRVLVSSGTLDLEGAVSGKGTDTISGASTLEFDSTVGGGQTIDFSGGALDLLDPQGFSAKIAGFASPDMVQLAGDWNFSSFSETGNGMMGNLTLSSGGTTNTFHFLGDYTASDFSIASGATTIIGHTHT
jgi:hypothetical protein